MNLEVELERCDREIHEILNRSDVKAGEAPAWLVTLGIQDWQFEKRLIVKEHEESLGSPILEGESTQERGGDLEPHKGETWQRQNGSRFTIERVDQTYVHYWLAMGSRPQYRSIARRNLHRYKKVI